MFLPLPLPPPLNSRFISPVDKVETRGLSQVVTSFQSDGLGKKPFLSLVQSGSRYVFAVDGARSVIYDSGTDAAERGSFVGLTSLRPTLLSPPPHPSASFDRRFRLYFCLVVSGAVILLLVLVVIVAAI